MSQSLDRLNQKEREAKRLANEVKAAKERLAKEQEAYFFGNDDAESGASGRRKSAGLGATEETDE